MPEIADLKKRWQWGGTWPVLSLDFGGKKSRSRIANSRLATGKLTPERRWIGEMDL